MIKPVYTIPETAPMKFYRFLTKFGLPAGIFIGIINLIIHLGAHDLHWLDGIVMIAHIVLLFFSIDSLCRMEWSGVRVLYANVLLSLGYNLFFLLMYLVLNLPNLPSEAVGGTISNSIISLMYWIYFSKRRLLFTPAPAYRNYPIQQESIENESADIETPSVDETPTEEQVTEAIASPAEHVETVQQDFSPKSPSKSRVSLSLPVLTLLIAAICVSCGAIGYFCYSTGYNVGNDAGYEMGHQTGYDEGHNDGYLSAETSSLQTISNLRDEIDSLQEETAFLNDDREYLQSILDERYDEWWFYHTSAVIVTTTGNKYHRHGCPHLDGHRYFIYNIENAEYQGYTPCLDCWDE